MADVIQFTNKNAIAANKIAAHVISHIAEIVSDLETGKASFDSMLMAEHITEGIALLASIHNAFTTKEEK